jgi:hypothetical protein
MNYPLTQIATNSTTTINTFPWNPFEGKDLVKNLMQFGPNYLASICVVYLKGS